MTAADDVVFLLDVDNTLLDLEQRYPARHYVMVDDKLRILAAMKKVLGDPLTTVFLRQGRYALDPQDLSTYPPADLAIEETIFAESWSDLMYRIASKNKVLTNG
jgi:hypothetical protein